MAAPVHVSLEGGGFVAVAGDYSLREVPFGEEGDRRVLLLVDDREVLTAFRDQTQLREAIEGKRARAAAAAEAASSAGVP